MKKIFVVATFLMIASFVSAQSTSPRFGTPPSGDNTGRVLTYLYQSKAYVATDTIKANAYEVTVKYAAITGAMTIKANVTTAHVTDKLNLVLVPDDTARLVTLSTGFAVASKILLAPNSKVVVAFTFNGTAWVKEQAQDPVPLTVTGVITGYTATATVTAAAVAGGVLSVTSGTNTLTLPTATQLSAQLGATVGSYFDFVVLNAGAGGTVTIAVGSGITASGFPGTNTLTLAASTTIGVATFRLTFISATAATLTRIS